ncbi:MAG TPA: MarR family transcriptional regulator [Kouleothrix sp.]|uniref:MarR family winged helix-turn-helix transcriptional regulator n=1 Tax=Kouleothrix sp. TaxID=2779161 RepID=UPI002BC1E642|nr:MarR family transcriptional regulator [Kouleothrix sp.]
MFSEKGRRMGTQGSDPFEQIERAIIQIGWLGQRQFMQLLAHARFDLTIPQYHTLLHLNYCHGECKMSDLARATHQSAASLTGVVDRLLEKRLVERGRPEGDRRQVVVSVTERGRELLRAIEHTRRDELRAALEHIRPEDLHELQRLLDAVLAAMLHTIEAAEPPFGMHSA